MQTADFIKTLDKRAAQESADQKTLQNQQLAQQNTQQIVDTITEAVKMLMAFQAQHQPKVKVTNQKFPTSIKTPDIQKVVNALENLKQPIQDNKLDDSKIVGAVEQLNESIKKLPTSFPDFPKPVTEVTVKNQPDYGKDLKSLKNSIDKIDVKPVINLPEEKPDDYTPILSSLEKVVTAVQQIKLPQQKPTDLSPLVEATNAVQSTIQNLKFPVPNYVLPFKDVNGKATQVQLDSSGNIPVSSSGGVASSVSIADGSTPTTKGSVVASTTPSVNGIVVVNPDGSTIAGGGGGTQYTDGGTPPAHAVGTVPVYDSGGTWKSVSTTNKLPVNTGLTQPTTPSDTQPISASALPLPTGAGTSANQSTIIANQTNGTQVSKVLGNTTPADGLASTNIVPTSTEIFNGTNFDRARSVGSLAGSSTGTGLPGVGAMGIYNSSAPTLTNATYERLQLNINGALKTDSSATTQPVSNAGLTNLDVALSTRLKPADTLTKVATVDTITNPVAVTGTFWQTTQPVSLATNTPDVTDRAARLLGHVTVDNASIAVTLASTTVTNTVATKETRSSTNTTATVAGSASVVTLIASNANRLGATITNESSAVLYLKLGPAASLTDYTCTLAPTASSVNAYYEVPFGYTGIITGIWASATGNARVGELT